jgi:histone H3/H4
MFNEEAAPAARDNLVVGSKVKAYVKSKGAMSSGVLIGAVSDKVYALLDDAIARAQSNKRSTVKDTDL